LRRGLVFAEKQALQAQKAQAFAAWVFDSLQKIDNQVH
jgi:hypothetical protein